MGSFLTLLGAGNAGISYLSEFSDNFNDNSLNTSLWVEAEAGGATFTEQNSRGEVALASSSTSSSVARIDSITPRSLVGSQAYLQVTTVTSGGTDADSIFLISAEATPLATIGATNGFRFIKERATIYAQRIVAGVITSVASTAYNGTTHAWWKIRESGGTIYWEVSTDGTTWNSFASYAHSMNIGAMYVHIGAACYKAETNPGNFFFDNFNTGGV